MWAYTENLLYNLFYFVLRQDVITLNLEDAVFLKVVNISDTFMQIYIFHL